MRMYDVIEKKRDGGVLTAEEIQYAVLGYTRGEIPDYQMSALLMAIYFQGMNEEETLELTMTMANSGNTLDLSGIKGIKVDKHSTGGVGDKTSLVLGPMVAAAGVPVAKMSGRGLGHTGGTIDKLESIPGFSTTIDTERFFDIVNSVGMSIVGQTKNLAPADKKLYALRDVTATVNSIPLIASSIMSKKIASGADAIVLDVKVGSGAFMTELSQAEALAKEMVRIGTGAGRNTVAVISDMDQPLGNYVGNALEVQEAIRSLKGEGPEDLMELCYTLGSYMLVLGGRTTEVDEARKILKERVEDGSALGVLREFVEAQGGDGTYIQDENKFQPSDTTYEIKAKRSGYISQIRCEQVGKTSLLLGGGRETKESTIDLRVGIVLCKKVGDQVTEGDVLAIVHSDGVENVQEVERMLTEAFAYSDQPVAKHVLIQKIITKDDL